MRSESWQSPTEIHLLASRRLAAVFLALGLLALAATWLSALGPLPSLGLSLLILLAILHGLRSALRPDLRLRLGEARLEYRHGAQGPWHSLSESARCFASPWFIGWQGRAGRSHGLFKCQLDPADFRRLLVFFRHRSGR